MSSRAPSTSTPGSVSTPRAVRSKISSVSRSTVLASATRESQHAVGEDLPLDLVGAAIDGRGPAEEIVVSPLLRALVVVELDGGLEHGVGEIEHRELGARQQHFVDG